MAQRSHAHCLGRNLNLVEHQQKKTVLQKIHLKSCSVHSLCLSLSHWHCSLDISMYVCVSQPLALLCRHQYICMYLGYKSMNARSCSKCQAFECDENSIFSPRNSPCTQMLVYGTNCCCCDRVKKVHSPLLVGGHNGVTASRGGELDRIVVPATYVVKKKKM